MERLIDGFRRFKETIWAEHSKDFVALARDGQTPRALVIACSDSRVDPQMILSAGPGEIFTVRNVANLVPPYAPDEDNHGTSAAVEFAVRSLEVPDIIIIGHSECGGIQALMRGDVGAYRSDFIANWMKIASSARERAVAAAKGDAAAAVHICEEEAVKISLGHLMTFPWLRERVEQGKLKLHGLIFDIARGELRRLQKDGSFKAV